MKAPDGWPRTWPLLLFAAVAGGCFAVLRGALDGPFISDDVGYIVANVYLHELSFENVVAFFDPGSPAQIYAVGNYSPIHLLLHALEWQIFADHTFGYHLLNVLVHALACTLLAALLLASRVPSTAALVGVLIFAVHPANVQAVAWISQLKSTAGLAFALGALLALSRRPWLGLLLFALGILTKAAAAFALPMAVALLWARRAPARQWLWLGVWGLVFGAYVGVEFAEFRTRGWVDVPAFADPWVHVRSVGAYATRYLVMAATSWGVSAFQEPDPVVSLLDPWWLASIPLALLIGARAIFTLARREEEGAWWLAAIVSWLPISQIFPFVHPMADHYLYFVLPGLIGGIALWASRWRAGASLGVRRAALAASLGLVVFFAWHSSMRAPLWQSDLLLSLDAARHFPEGRTARLLRARSAAQAGDTASAVAELRGAEARGMFEFRVLELDPGLAPLRAEPAFRQLVHDWAGLWIEWAERSGASTQSELRIVGLAHLKRDEFDAAVRAYERALAAGGRDPDGTRRDLEEARSLRIQRGGSDGKPL
ncbi:MAG: hypothetical protein QF890_12485 [Myxococcota bacterium]|jgi:4-amino-4-deoxy-L-arabinose transferase-like glycosyltransferase|nr:hypothetical protein [Deltaproteobacteria bacterium]MCP4239727.1 hypothetical protein [bacterium]MDP6074446.1 hypothetical protein [Myxococcota bacterium]MDP6241690.1 hypothetical protein [Myxococcota bacterium]MDP7073831.1 hypothetical protein [Myxococcota bacterium]